MTRSLHALVLLAGVTLAPPVLAEEPAAKPAEPRKLVFDVDFAVANLNDKSLNESSGREQQTKLPYALLGVSGDLTPQLSYRLELNGLNDSVRPEPFLPSERTPFFFPNLADPDFGVSSKPEGQYKVDDYKNTGWDPYIQEQHLRRAFVDVHDAKRRFGMVAGRFFLPIGLPLEALHWFTAKDLTHIQAINNQTDIGAQLYWRFGDEDKAHGRLSAAVVTGNGNPYHDYVYFDFTRAASEDTNSAAGGVADLRLSLVKGLDLALSGEYNFVGSRVAFGTSVQRSKHYDHKLVASAQYRPQRFRHAQAFGELVHYQWGLRDTSAAQLPGPPVKSPIDKNGYYVGLDIGVPLPRQWGTVGIVLTREELNRDDSLIAYLAAQQQLGVRLGKKERGTIVKVYAEWRYLTAFFFLNDLHNPFPQVSAIVPTSGPLALQPSQNAKKGIGLRFRASF